MAAGSPGAVYTQTQDPAGNHVVVFDRAGDGRLTKDGSFATGGVGAPVTPPLGLPILDSQGGVELTSDSRLLFTVNAGSDTVTSFRVTPDGLRRVDVEGSGGDLPISVDSYKGLLYVLNVNSGTISGLRYDSQGRMTPIPGSTRSLTHGAAGVGGQVGFDEKGRVVTVTERLADAIDMFPVLRDGRLGAPTSNPSNAPTPFGFAYSRGNLFVSDAGPIGPFTGAASSYAQSGTRLASVDAVPTGQLATCWMVVTNDGRYAFASNTLSGSVSRLRIERGGGLTLLGSTPTHLHGGAAPLEGGGFAGDEALSQNSRYLYVLTAVQGDGKASIDVYRVGSDGSLTRIQTLASALPAPASGLAAR